MSITIIRHGSKEYEQMIALRIEVLRKPLGLTFTAEDLQKEKEDILIAAFENTEIAGCCVLTQKSDSIIQLRQMAVWPHWQCKGIGSAIIRFAEAIAKERGYAVLIMHAREEAAAFYKKCGYEIMGSRFTEVGIPHYKMEKHF